MLAVLFPDRFPVSLIHKKNLADTRAIIDLCYRPYPGLIGKIICHPHSIARSSKAVRLRGYPSSLSAFFRAPGAVIFSIPASEFVLSCHLYVTCNAE
jgi:hypothetical protein